MVRCYFNVREGEHLFRDDEGCECASTASMEREAVITATSLARDYAANGTYGSVCVEVVEDHGRVLLVAAVEVQVKRAGG